LNCPLPFRKNISDGIFIIVNVKNSQASAFVAIKNKLAPRPNYLANSGI